MGSETDPPQGREGGRSDAAADAVQRFESRVRILTRRYLPPDRADEVARRVLLRVERSIREGRAADLSRLGPYVYEVALRTIREAGSGETFDLDDLPFDHDERDASTRALEALEAEDREILRLAFHRGLCPSEIAEVLDLSMVEVLDRKRRALKRFTDLHPDR